MREHQHILSIPPKGHCFFFFFFSHLRVIEKCPAMNLMNESISLLYMLLCIDSHS